MKIVYVLASLATQGGTERIVAEKSSYFSEKFGYDVYIVCYGQQPDLPNFYTISNKVKQINLGLELYKHYKFPYPKRLWIKFNLRRLLKKNLTSVIKSIDPDILIGISHFRADFVCSINCRAKKIIESHVPKSSIESIDENRSFLLNFYKIIYDKIYFRTIIKNADALVLLTEERSKLWFKSIRTTVIPNSSTMPIERLCDTKAKRVIAVGRLSKEKGFDRLIDIWKLVATKYPDWHLDIYGEGYLKEELTSIIKSNKIPNIILQGSTNNISQKYADSSICVVTSYYEGFSLVILEAMRHGLPCIAFDCPYGPRSIIENEKSGYLIEDGNIPLYTKRLCSLIENERLRQQISKAALERSKSFDIAKIMMQWKKLFEDIIRE